jgi:hypothetical protein
MTESRSSQSEPSVRVRRKAILIQERDLDMLSSIACGRVLTTEPLEWLHFASWRTRYRNYAACHDGTDTPGYQPNSNLYRRLRGLCAGQFVRRITRALNQGRTAYYRLPDAYVLTEAGAELLCERRGVERRSLWYTPARARAIQNLDHAVAIGRLYAALRAELEYRGRQLGAWQGDHVLARNVYDRIAIAGVREPLPILPDATFVLDGTRYFVEIDRGTRPLRSWTDKVRAYEAYQWSPLLEARYQAAQFQVLIVAPTQVRLTRIAEEVVRVTRQVSPDYLFLRAEHIHPTTIRRGWQRIASVDWASQRVIDRMVESPTVMLTNHTLWEQRV